MRVIYQHSTDEFGRPVTLFTRLSGRMPFLYALRLLHGDVPHVRMWIAADSRLQLGGFRDHFMRVSNRLRRHMDSAEFMRVGQYFGHVVYVSMVTRSWVGAVLAWLPISVHIRRPTHGFVIQGHCSMAEEQSLIGGWKIGEVKADVVAERGMRCDP
jgi:hypothetical protein